MYVRKIWKKLVPNMENSEMQLLRSMLIAIIAFCLPFCLGVVLAAKLPVELNFIGILGGIAGTFPSMIFFDWLER